MIYFNNIYKSIMMLSCIIILFSCQNNSIKEVNKIISSDTLKPLMIGEEMELIYSDSARIRYLIKTPRYAKYNIDKHDFEEFERGIEVKSYDKKTRMIGSIRSLYANKKSKEELWELRDSVVIINSEGKKLETELLFWDMRKKKIYTDRYVRLTSDKQIIEGYGFESDQDIQHPEFKNISGTLELEPKKK